MTFPTGVKLCYNYSQPNISSLKFKTPFTSVLTNINGERLYLTTCYYFMRFEALKFYQEYEIDPIKEYFKLNSVLNKMQNKNIDLEDYQTKFENNLQTCTRFINSDYILVPFSLNIVSSFYDESLFSKFCELLVKCAVNSEDLLQKFIHHLIYEIPNFDCIFNFNKIKLYAPFEENAIIIFKEKNFFTFFQFESLFLHFSLKNIITIINLLLLEQKVIFVADEVNLLTQTTEAFIELLYPLKWTNTYISNASHEFIKYVQSFMPFIIGIESSMFKTAKSMFDSEAIYVVNIDKDQIEVSYNNKKTKNLNFDDTDKYFPLMPENLVENLIEELKVHKLFYFSYKVINKETFNHRIKETFVKFMAYMFGDYKKYTINIDTLPLFNTNSFVNCKNNKNKAFFSDFTQTVNFRHFSQDKVIGLEFQKYCEKYKNVPLCKINESNDKGWFSNLRRKTTTVLNHDKNNFDNNIFLQNTRMCTDPNNNNDDEDFESNKLSLILFPFFIESNSFIKENQNNLNCEKIENLIKLNFKPKLNNVFIFAKNVFLDSFEEPILIKSYSQFLNRSETISNSSSKSSDSEITTKKKISRTCLKIKQSNSKINMQRDNISKKLLNLNFIF